MKKLLLLFCLIPTLVFADSGGGAGSHITSESQHPLRHKANRIMLSDTGGYYYGDTVEDALTEIATGLIIAPKDADYLVGTANSSLTNEIVAGTTPGGELGGTWASPTVDTIHSGSTHHSAVTLSGTPDYITLSGQDIIRGKVDIGDDTNLAVVGPMTLTDDSISMAVATTIASGYVVTSDWNSWTNHVADNTQAHSDYMLNTGDTTTGDYNFTAGDLTTTGILTAEQLTSTDDLTVNDIASIDGTITISTTGMTNSSGEISFDNENLTTTGNITASGLTVNNNTVNLSDTTDEYVLAFDVATQTWRGIAQSAGSGDITSVGDVVDGAAFDGTQGTTLTFNNAGGDATLVYDGTDFDISKPITVVGTITSSGTFDVAGAVGLTLGSADVIGFTVTTDGTGNAEFTLPNDVIGDADIDWGTGAGQVSGADISLADCGAITTSGANDITSGGDLIAGGADISVSTTGVKLTGNNGTLTLLGLGDGQDENLKLDFNTTVNSVDITSPTSGVTKIDAGTIAWEGKFNSSDATAGASVTTGGLTFKDGLYTSGTLSGATTALDNLASVAINTSLISDTANTDDLGTEAIFWRKGYFASQLSFEGATDDNYQTTFSITDPTSSDKTITFPDSTFTVGDMTYANTRFYVGSFTRDISIASGTQAVTGVGFSPKAVIFFALIDGTRQVSWGQDTLSASQGVSDFNAVTANTYTVISTSIGVYVSGSAWYMGEINSLDADGFTINWTKTGSPTGTLTVLYIAYK